MADSATYANTAAYISYAATGITASYANTVEDYEPQYIKTVGQANYVGNTPYSYLSEISLNAVVANYSFYSTTADLTISPTSVSYATLASFTPYSSYSYGFYGDTPYAAYSSYAVGSGPYSKSTSYASVVSYASQSNYSVKALLGSYFNASAIASDYSNYSNYAFQVSYASYSDFDNYAWTTLYNNGFRRVYMGTKPGLILMYKF